MLVNILVHIVAWTLIITCVVGIPLAIIGLLIMTFDKDK